MEEIRKKIEQGINDIKLNYNRGIINANPMLNVELSNKHHRLFWQYDELNDELNIMVDSL